MEKLTAVAGTQVPASPVAGAFADPALIHHQGLWWLYPTSDGLEDWSSTAFRALSSPDLVNWTDHGEILKLGVDVLWASDRAWAPAMIEKNGKFYFYFTANFNIGVAVGDSPTGPFVDLGEPLIAAGQFSGNMIDPAVFEDLDGSVYLYWGNETAYGVKLNADLVSFDSNAVVAWQPKGFREAASVHRNGETFYLSWSENDTRSQDYQVRYATGPSPLGPWQHQGVLLKKDPERGVFGTGHHCITELPDKSGWVIAAHRFGIPNGNGFNREIFFAPLHHNEQGLLEEVLIPQSLYREPLVNQSRPQEE